LDNTFGPITLLGSGETSLAGGRIIETIARRFPHPLRIAILETPAGFELNSPQVAGRIKVFLSGRLQNYRPQIDIIPARKLGTSFSPDDSHILQPLLQANLIFMGPGSPTYAVRQLRGSLAWDLVRARHHQGAALVFASAAVIAVGAYALPVYEIYKVGEDVSIVPGLDLFKDFYLNLSLIPHWNNTEGGEELDTSRCFIGLDRFVQWHKQLPTGHTTLGLDEHSGITFDFGTRICSVRGLNSVTLLRGSNSEIFPAGSEFSFERLGEFRMPETGYAGISARVLKMVNEKLQSLTNEAASIEVTRLLEERQQARLLQDWVKVDALRKKIAALGWQVQDTPDGQKIVRQS
jgi:hypothetical protein